MANTAGAHWRRALSSALAALAPLCAALPACAQSRAVSLAGLGQYADNLRQSLSGGSLSIEALRSDAALLGQAMPQSRMPGRFRARPLRQVSQTDLKPASVSELVSEARDVVSGSADVPEPKLQEAESALGEMDNAGRIAMDDGDKLQSNEMGVYQFTAGPDAGHIFLSRLTPDISALAGLGLAASTLIHESYHRVEKKMGQLRGESVAAEVGAFKAQYDYLKALYPTGEEIATRRAQLSEMMRQSPSADVAAALGFVTTMDALFGTDGVASNIRRLVLDLGYSQSSGRNSSFPSA